MLVEGLHLYLKVVQVFNIENVKILYYYIFGWGKLSSKIRADNLVLSLKHINIVGDTENSHSLVTKIKIPKLSYLTQLYPKALQ